MAMMMDLGNGICLPDSMVFVAFANVDHVVPWPHRSAAGRIGNSASYTVP